MAGVKDKRDQVPDHAPPELYPDAYVAMWTHQGITVYGPYPHGDEETTYTIGQWLKEFAGFADLGEGSYKGEFALYGRVRDGSVIIVTAPVLGAMALGKGKRGSKASRALDRAWLSGLPDPPC